MIDRFAGKARIVLGGRRQNDKLILGVSGYAVLLLGVLLVLMLRSPERPWGVVAFLASADAAYITGAVIPNAGCAWSRAGSDSKTSAATNASQRAASSPSSR